jgi:glyoxylase-like metal-dependent hydrolase (beta-lactamase superfamily II)
MHDPMRIGRAEVVVVCEGYAPLGLADEMPGAEVDWGAERARYPWAFVDERSWPWHVHAFALRTPGGLVLVDAGVSPFPPVRPWAEHTPLEEALTQGAVDPTEVRMVVHTHLHADHAGGSVVDGEPRYPNAVHVVHPADWSRSVGTEHPNWARGAMQRLFDLGMVELGAEDREVWPGIRVAQAPGHTPGHRSVLLDEGDRTMLFTGDLLHTPIQIARPEHPSSHDVDAAEACRSRVALVGPGPGRGLDRRREPLRPALRTGRLDGMDRRAVAEGLMPRAIGAG